jgi:methionyl aminopeptidase
VVGSESSNSITLKTAEEIELLFHANQIVAGVLHLLEQTIQPGITTFQLDKLAEEFCHDHDGIPAFKGYRGFPASLCASVNEEVVHGIPSKRKVLREGDIVSLDFGVLYQGFYGDSAITVPVGQINTMTSTLIETTKIALYKGIEQAVVGNRVSDISRAVQQVAEQAGFSVVRQFVGHGIGSNLHEPPEIPNYVQRHASPRLAAGMVLAIEPMVNMGAAGVKILKDQWTVVTQDNKWSAHFEHSITITTEGPRILSELDQSKHD